jgi:hypothetical protein
MRAYLLPDHLQPAVRQHGWAYRPTQRLLLRALLPLPRLDLFMVVPLFRYQRRHKLAAYCSHRKRRLHRLESFKPP